MMFYREKIEFSVGPDSKLLYFHLNDADLKTQEISTRTKSTWPMPPTYMCLQAC